VKTLSAAFSAECRTAEQGLLQTLRHEKDLAVDNFDSGVPFESAVRRVFRRFLPRRYAVTSGLIVDRNGLTAGQCDLIIFNDIWFPLVKSSAGDEAGRAYLPIEGVYAVGEVKQTLSVAELDRAMEKVVKCHRLRRPRTYAHRVVENRESGPCPHGLTNPLFSFVLAGGISAGEDMQDLLGRFFDISKQLKRLEMVRALCVLGEGAVVWSFYDIERNEELRPALFMEGDLFQSVVPTLSPASDRGALYCLLMLLHLHLFHSVLAPEDLVALYGADPQTIKVPIGPEFEIPPDPEWVDLLQTPCSDD
jgi:hypothetical protein